MPWRPRNLVDEREEFQRLAQSGDEHFSRLCLSFGISRRIGYKWLARYQQAGCARDSLENQSQRPHRTKSFGENVQQEVLRLRAQHRCGPKKLSLLLKAQGVSIGRSTVSAILKRNQRTASNNASALALMRGLLVADHPQTEIACVLPSVRLSTDTAERLRCGGLQDRKKIVAVVARMKGIRLHSVVEFLGLTSHTIARYSAEFAENGFERLLRRRKRNINDDDYKGAVFALLHSPPSASGINCTSWKMADLQRLLREKGYRLSEKRIRRIIKAGGYRWRKAKIVLTSTDPDYEAKLSTIKETLASLKPDEAFFSIDEYGPFAIKHKPGKKLVEPGADFVVQQWQKSKGWTIITAALELSRNQVTHFYSRSKNTEEMIKLADLLRSQYRSCSRIFLSWDAASWHISKRLLAYVEQANAGAENACYPQIELAPLPACAQFLNVVESIFSGMARAIIHNSDYPSLEAAKAAIDQYFAERNAHFEANPKRAGRKIWGSERIPSEFYEGQHCKDPESR
jgi:transposase